MAVVPVRALEYDVGYVLVTAREGVEPEELAGSELVAVEELACQEICGRVAWSCGEDGGVAAGEEQLKHSFDRRDGLSGSGSMRIDG